MLNQTTNLKLLIVTAFCLRVSERDCVLVAPVLCFAGRNYHLTTKLSLQRASTSSHGPYRLYDHHSVTAFVKGLPIRTSVEGRDGGVIRNRSRHVQCGRPHVNLVHVGYKLSLNNNLTQNSLSCIWM